jgi:putative ABC transport system permease protein
MEVYDSVKNGTAVYETTTFRQLNPVLQLLAFVSVIVYLYLSHKLISKLLPSDKI